MTSLKRQNNMNTWSVSSQLLGTLLLSAALILGGANATFGQDYNNNSDDYSTYDNPDSTTTDGYSSEGYDYSDYGNDYNLGGSEEKPKKKVILKPYVRFIPPYDSTRELVMYQAVIEIFDRDGYEVELDTIYYRAQQWLQAEYGKDLKKFMAADGVNEKSSEMEYKIRVTGTFACVIEPNEFTKITNGMVQYVMEIRVRDGRYRYVFKNLVHIADPRPGEKEGKKTYFEYLMKTKDDVRAGDQVLIAADKKINSMIAELQRACQTAPIEEEDEW
ncbi:MAG: hypothetical protein ACI8ZN_002025 [Bacteroidia bacterium]|jgi:hypothetical protein